MIYSSSNDEPKFNPKDPDSTNFDQSALPDRSTYLNPQPSTDGHSIHTPKVPYQVLEIGTGLFIQIESTLHGRHHLDHFVIEAPSEICNIFRTYLQSMKSHDEIRSFLINDTVVPGSYIRHTLDRDLESEILESARNTIVKLTERAPPVEELAVNPTLRRYDLEEYQTSQILHGRITLLWDSGTDSLDFEVDVVPPHKGYEKLLGTSIPVSTLDLTYSEYAEELPNATPAESLLYELYFRGIEFFLIHETPAEGDLLMAGGPDLSSEPISDTDTHIESEELECGPDEEPDTSGRPITNLGRYVGDQVCYERSVSTHAKAYFMREELYPGYELITFAMSRIITGERCYWNQLVTTEFASKIERRARSWICDLASHSSQRHIEALSGIATYFSKYSFDIHPGGAFRTPPLSSVVSYFQEGTQSEWIRRLGQHGLPSQHKRLASCYTQQLPQDLLQDITTYGFMLIDKPKHLTWTALIVCHNLNTNEVSLRLVPSFRDGLGSAWVDVAIPNLHGASEQDAFDTTLRPILKAFSRGTKIGQALEEELKNQGIDAPQWSESCGFPLPKDPYLPKTPFILAAAHARALIKELSTRLLLRATPQEPLERLTPLNDTEGRVGYYLTVDIAIKNGREFHPVIFEIHPDGLDSASIVSGKVIYCHDPLLRQSVRPAKGGKLMRTRRLLDTLDHELRNLSKHRHSAS